MDVGSSGLSDARPLGFIPTFQYSNFLLRNGRSKQGKNMKGESYEHISSNRV